MGILAYQALSSASHLLALTSPSVIMKLRQNLRSLEGSPVQEIKIPNYKTNSKADLLLENSFLLRNLELVGAVRGQALCGWGKSGRGTFHNFKDEDSEPQRGSDLHKVTQLVRGGSVTQNQ